MRPNRAVRSLRETYLEDTMKEKLRMAMVLAFGLAVLASASDRSCAQEISSVHHHYIVVDMGSLGGPGSIVFEQGTRSLNNQGTFTGAADTPNLDPNSPQNPCSAYPDGNIDPYVQHVFRWELGEKTDLGTYPGGTSSCSQWISDRGWIVGGATNGKMDLLAGYPEATATLWRNGKILNLGTLGGNESYAWSVNNLGQVVGFALNTTPDQSQGNVFAWGATQAHAFLWQNGRMQDLGTLGGPDSDALLINERGEIAGMSITSSESVDPFLWKNGKMIDLGTLGGTFGYPDMINSRGQIVGQSNLAGDQGWHPYLWENGVLKDLGTLGGSQGEARWINDAGEAAGYATFPGEQVGHATLWNEGKIIDLGATADFPCSYANGINSRGQVLGALQHCPNNAPREAFLWENGDLVNLNTLIPPGSEIVLIGANNANDRGEIVAAGTLQNGDSRAVLLIPCDDEHPNLEGCDYSLVEASNAPKPQLVQTLHAGSTLANSNKALTKTNRHRSPGVSRPD
jgi:probable HAF family extracellular repeat protein